MRAAAVMGLVTTIALAIVAVIWTLFTPRPTVGSPTRPMLPDLPSRDSAISVAGEAGHEALVSRFLVEPRKAKANQRASRSELPLSVATTVPERSTADDGSNTVLLAKSNSVTGVPVLLREKRSLQEVQALPTLGDALDAPQLVWQTSESSQWSATTVIVDTHDGVDAARGESGRLMTTVEGPCTVRFWWRTDSGARVNFSTGQWQQEAHLEPSSEWTQHTLDLFPGEHQLEWSLYATGVEGTSAVAWLDEVEVIPAQVLALAEAVDAPELEWVSGGTTPWNAYRLPNSGDGDVAIGQAVAVEDTAWVETILEGPGELHYQSRAKVYLNELLVEERFDETLYATRYLLSIPDGTHQVRWDLKESTWPGFRYTTLDQVSYDATSPARAAIELPASIAFLLTGPDPVISVDEAAQNQMDALEISDQSLHLHMPGPGELRFWVKTEEGSALSSRNFTVYDDVWSEQTITFTTFSPVLGLEAIGNGRVWLDQFSFVPAPADPIALALGLESETPGSLRISSETGWEPGVLDGAPVGVGSEYNALQLVASRPGPFVFEANRTADASPLALYLGSFGSDLLWSQSETLGWESQAIWVEQGGSTLRFQSYQPEGAQVFLRQLSSVSPLPIERRSGGELLFETSGDEQWSYFPEGRGLSAEVFMVEARRAHYVSLLETAVDGRGTLRFGWQATGQLEVEVDGQTVAIAPRGLGFYEVEIPLLTDTTHEIRWRLTSSDEGEYGRVDHVRVSEFTSPLGEALDLETPRWFQHGPLGRVSAQTVISYEGQDAVRIGTFSHGEHEMAERLETSVDGPGVLRFRGKMQGNGYFGVALDGKTVFEMEEADWAMHHVAIPEGRHRLTFAGSRLRFGSSVPDVAFWLDAWEFLPATSLSEASDGGLAFTTGGDGLWDWLGTPSQNAVTGTAVLRAPPLGDSRGHTWIETSITGPGTLRYADLGEFRMEVTVNGIPVSLPVESSNEPVWRRHLLSVGEGQHMVRWTAKSGALDAVLWSPHKATLHESLGVSTLDIPLLLVDEADWELDEHGDPVGGQLKAVQSGAAVRFWAANEQVMSLQWKGPGFNIREGPVGGEGPVWQTSFPAETEVWRENGVLLGSGLREVLVEAWTSSQDRLHLARLSLAAPPLLTLEEALDLPESEGEYSVVPSATGHFIAVPAIGLEDDFVIGSEGSLSLSLEGPAAVSFDWSYGQRFSVDGVEHELWTSVYGVPYETSIGAGVHELKWTFDHPLALDRIRVRSGSSEVAEALDLAGPVPLRSQGVHVTQADTVDGEDAVAFEAGGQMEMELQGPLLLTFWSKGQSSLGISSRDFSYSVRDSDTWILNHLQVPEGTHILNWRSYSGLCYVDELRLHPVQSMSEAFEGAFSLAAMPPLGWRAYEGNEPNESVLVSLIGWNIPENRLGMSLEGPGTLSFDWTVKASTSSTPYRYAFSVDGETRHLLHRNDQEWHPVTMALGPGQHALAWSASHQGWSGNVALTNVRFVPGQDLSGAEGIGLPSDGSFLTQGVGALASPVDPLVLDPGDRARHFLSSARGLLLYHQEAADSEEASMAELTLGWPDSLWTADRRTAPATPEPEGGRNRRLFLSFDESVSLLERSVTWTAETATILSDVRFLPVTETIPLAEALGVPNWEFTMDAANPWEALRCANDTGASEMLAMPSGNASWFETVVEGPMVIDFNWHGDDGNRLEVLVEDETWIADSRSSWEPIACHLSIPPGSHTIRWKGTLGWLDAFRVSDEPSAAVIALDLPSQVPLSIVSAAEQPWSVVSDAQAEGGTALVLGGRPSQLLTWAEGMGSFRHAARVSESGALALERWTSSGTLPTLYYSSEDWIYSVLPLPSDRVELQLRSRFSRNVGVVVFDDFEFALRETPQSVRDDLNLSFTTGSDGDVPWRGLTGDPFAHDGDDRMVAAALERGTTAWLETIVDGPGTLHFWWRSEASSSASSAGIEMRVNDRTLGQPSIRQQWERGELALPPGQHQIRWNAEATASLDEVLFEPGSASLAEALDLEDVPVLLLGADEATVILSGEDAHDGEDALSVGLGQRVRVLSVAEASQWFQFEWKELGDHDWYAEFRAGSRQLLNLSAGAEWSSGQWLNHPGDGYFEWAWFSVDTGEFALDRLRWGPLEDQVALTEALDLDLPITTGGDVAWEGRMTSAVLDIEDVAMISETHPGGSEAWLSTELVGPGQLNFNWMLLAEDYRAAIAFELNGEELSRSGQASWERVLVSIPPGTHLCTWRYHSGTNVGTIDGQSPFLDEVTFLPERGSIRQTLGLSPDVGILGRHPLTAALRAMIVIGEPDSVIFEPNGGTVSLELLQPGPGSLSFWSKVDSESALRWQIDGRRRSLIHVEWALQSQVLRDRADLGMEWSLSGEGTAQLRDVQFRDRGITLAEALDTTLTVETADSESAWEGVTADASADGVDAATPRAFHTTPLIAKVIGPGTLEFWWRSARGNRDEGTFTWEMDGVVLGSRRDVFPWEPVVQEVPPGEHTIRWRPSSSLTHMVDRLSFTPTYLATPPSLEQWLDSQGVGAGTRGPLVDLNQNGVNNLLGYAFLLDPVHREPLATPSGERGDLPTQRVVSDWRGDRLELQFLRRKNAPLVYRPLFSSDLKSWERSPAPESVMDLSDGWERVTVWDQRAIEDEGQRFGQVEIEETP